MLEVGTVPTLTEERKQKKWVHRASAWSDPQETAADWMTEAGRRGKDSAGVKTRDGVEEQQHHLKTQAYKQGKHGLVFKVSSSYQEASRQSR